MRDLVRTLLLLILIFGASLLVSQADAATSQGSSSALGLVIGAPTGISGRVTMDPAHSLEAALAYSVAPYQGFHVHLTYLKDRARSFSTKVSPIDLYWGMGARMISIQTGTDQGKVVFGPRAPIGLLMSIKDPDLEFFGELAATLDLVPRSGVSLDAGIGARVWF